MTSQKIITSVKKTYNEISPEFSATRNYIWPDLKPYLNNIPKNASVLDVGCGNGRLLLGLPKSIKYTGLDQSENLIDEAKKNHPNKQFIVTDITKPQIWKHLPQFDYIYCVAVLHHLPTQNEQLFVLNQIKTHLKPKGKCLLTVWNLWQGKYLKYHFDLSLKKQNLFWVNIPFQGKKRFCFAHHSLYLKYLLKKAGLPLKVSSTSQNYLLDNFQLP